MSEEQAVELPYEVRLEEVEGGKKVKILSSGGSDFLALSESFTDEQIVEVYNVSNHYFNMGMDAGTKALRMSFLELLGLGVATDAEMEEQDPDQE